MQEIYLARQPIYNRKLKAEAFELLYRQGSTIADPDDDALGDSQLFLNVLTEIGLAHVVGEQMAFVNVERNFIIDGSLTSPLSPQLVLGIVGDITVDMPLLTALRDLSQQGGRFALDDYVDNEASRALLEVADYVKIDILKTPEEEVRRLVPLLRQHRVSLIAKHIESEDMLDFCQSMGFDYFQGHHFSHPKLVKFRSIPTNQLAILQLVGKLNDPEASLESIESLITQDVSLSYKLLRHINSAYFGLGKRVESIHRAILLLGTDNIRAWATMISLANIDNNRSDLIITALIRAKMCEQLAEQAGLVSTENGFTVGLLSILDIMTQVPMEEIITHLPLADEINQALLRHEGLLGCILACTLAYEQGNWQAVDASGFDPDEVSDAYFAALSNAYRAAFELM